VEKRKRGEALTGSAVAKGGGNGGKGVHLRPYRQTYESSGIDIREPAPVPISLSDENKLHKFFGVFGEVTEAVVIRNESGYSRGFGFVTYADKETSVPPSPCPRRRNETGYTRMA